VREGQRACHNGRGECERERCSPDAGVRSPPPLLPPMLLLLLLAVGIIVPLLRN
jgi:hypothetical protein